MFRVNTTAELKCPTGSRYVVQIESCTQYTTIEDEIDDNETYSVIYELEFPWLSKDPFTEDDTVIFDPDKYGLVKKKT